MAPRKRTVADVREEKGERLLQKLLPWLNVPRRRRSHRNICRAMVVAPARLAAAPHPPPPPLRLPPPPPVERQLEFAELPIKKRIPIMVRAAQQNRHMCNICGKDFDTHYALGGHKAHHSRRRQAKASPGPQKTKLRRGPTKCPNCDRIFSSPQGLGGHKRCCKGRPQAAVDNGAGPSRKFLMFDLNELPPPEEDEMLALPWYGCGN